MGRQGILHSFLTSQPLHPGLYSWPKSPGGGTVLIIPISSLLSTIADTINLVLSKGFVATPIMALHSQSDQKTEASHVESLSPSGSVHSIEDINGLDSIEGTQSGRFAWLVSITAGVGGLLFGGFCIETHVVTMLNKYRI
jgi:hypothetical protein